MWKFVPYYGRNVTTNAIENKERSQEPYEISPLPHPPQPSPLPPLSSLQSESPTPLATTTTNHIIKKTLKYLLQLDTHGFVERVHRSCRQNKQCWKAIAPQIPLSMCPFNKIQVVWPTSEPLQANKLHGLAQR